MRITNRYNLPDSYYRALSQVYRPNPKRLSVTALIDAPLKRQLEIEHWDELEEDASERLWALLSKGLHKILAENSPGSTEDKFEIEVDGLTVVGKLDEYIPHHTLDTEMWHPATISDHKATAVRRFAQWDKEQLEQYERQLNCYAWGKRKMGHCVGRLQVCGILRDHMKGKTFSDNDYPKIPFAQIEVPLWSFIKQDAYVRERVALHSRMHGKCTPQEKWLKETEWAVKKKGNKTARGGSLCKSEAEAIEFIKAHPDKTWEIEQRPGESVCCMSYCRVRSVCPYNIYRKQNANNKSQTMA